MKSSKSIKLSHRPGATFAHLPEDLFDPLAIIMIQEDLMEFVEQDRPSRLIVDFVDVKRCGSEAVGALIRLAHRVRSYDGAIEVCRMNQQIQEVFEVLKLLDSIFPVCTDPDAVS